MTNHLVLGLDVEQRKEARGKTGGKAGHTWVWDRWRANRGEKGGLSLNKYNY